jgi:hypothetical protein
MKIVNLVKITIIMELVAMKNVKIVLMDVTLKEYAKIQHIAKEIYFMEINVISPARK